MGDSTQPGAGPRAHGVAERTSALEGVVKDPVSRRRFIAIAGGGAGASLSVLLAACGGSDDTTSTATGASSTSGTGTEQFGKGDLGILNYALTLEYLETAFYADVIKSGLFKGSDLKTIKTFGGQEAEHVAALTVAIRKSGGKPAKVPKTEFPLDDAKSVLKLAGTVENLGAAAYLGQAANITSPAVLAAALSIHSVEGRHAAAINTLLGETIVPDGAFAVPADAKTVLKSVQPYIVG